MRTLNSNVKGFKTKDRQKIKQARKSLEQHQINIATLSEASAKQTTRNADRIENQLKNRQRNANI